MEQNINRFYEILSNYSFFSRYVFTFFLVFLIFGIWWIFWFIPLKLAINDYKFKLKAFEEIKFEDSKESLKVLEEKVFILEREFEDKYKNLSIVNINSRINEIINYIKENDLILILCDSKQKRINFKNFIKVPYLFCLTGNFFNMFSFLELISKIEGIECHFCTIKSIGNIVKITMMLFFLVLSKDVEK